MPKPFEAGKGEYHVYRIRNETPTDSSPLVANQHYLGVDAVAWFVNKQSNWFSDKMASGTLMIDLASGLETYQVALGTFELKEGARTAPVFDNPVLPDRCYRGGPIVLTAFLTGVRKDTVIAGLLKSAAGASLSVVAGMVQTATITGPAKILGAAGDEIITGVKSVLTNSATQKQAFFDSSSGLKKGLQPSDIQGDETYILLHRGDELPEASLTVHQSGQLVLPYLNGKPLDDGVWLLLRMRRRTEYSGVRDWSDTEKRLSLKVRATVDDFSTGALSKDDALKRLRPSGSGNETLFDDYSKLRGVIEGDGVLTVAEAGVKTTALSAYLFKARKAIERDQPTEFIPSLKEVHGSIIAGSLDTDVMKNLNDHLNAVHAFRFEALPTKLRKIGLQLDAQALLKNVSGYKKTLSSTLLG